jgi:hypothetical protein
VKLWRVLPWDPSAPIDAEGGALWVPRARQGASRHDNPDRYGCLYLAEVAVSAMAEALAPFRGTGDLLPAMLARSGRQLALAELDLDRPATLIDLDDPAVLSAEALRPSIVATARRAGTQAYARSLFDEHPHTAGLRWWSTLESSWINVTLFDRALGVVAVEDVRELTIDDGVVRSAAALLGLA